MARAAHDRTSLGRAGIGHAELCLPEGYSGRGDEYCHEPQANRAVGVPYTDEMIDNATADLKAQADPMPMLPAWRHATPKPSSATLTAIRSV